jgi:hypothetical protein
MAKIRKGTSVYFDSVHRILEKANGEYKIPTIEINRDFERRVKKMQQYFVKGLPSLEIFVIINVLAGFNITLNNESIFVSKGKKLADGNTRRESMEQHPEQIPEHDVIYIQFDVDNEEDFKNIYYSYDSSASVENSADKITGAFNLLGMDLVSKTAKSGTLGEAIKAAYPGDRKDSILDKVAYFKNELQILDKTGLLNPVDKELKFQMLFAMALIVLKLYDHPETQLLRCITGLEILGREASDNLDITGDRWDGLTAICYEYFNPGKKGWIPAGMHRQTGVKTLEPQLNFLLYCFAKYMAKQKVDKTQGFQHSNWKGEYESTMQILSDRMSRIAA